MLIFTNFRSISAKCSNADRILFVCDIFNINLCEILNKNHFYVLNYITINYISVI